MKSSRIFFDIGFALLVATVIILTLIWATTVSLETIQVLGVLAYFPLIVGVVLTALGHWKSKNRK